MLETNRIYNEDCLEGMKELPESSVSLVVTDPPYGVRKKEEWDNKENFLNNLEKWLVECHRVAKRGVVWFCADKMLPFILNKATENNITFHRLLIWNKPPGSQFSGAVSNNLWYSFEPILIFSKGDNIEVEDNDASFGYGVLNYRTVPKSKFGHPTTKPIGLIEEIIEHYSKEGEVILDPFIGSGTTAAACIKTDREFIGFEKDRGYYNIAIKRIGKYDKKYYDVLSEDEKPKQIQMF